MGLAADIASEQDAKDDIAKKEWNDNANQTNDSSLENLDEYTEYVAPWRGVGGYWSRNKDKLDARDAAARAEHYARWIDTSNRQLGAEQDQQVSDRYDEQFEHSKDIDERNFQRSNELDEYRKNLVSDMLADAGVSSGELANRLGDASSDVTRAYDKAKGIRERKILRLGVNPNSGVFARNVDNDEADLVAADVAARNNVRKGVREEERGLTQRARLAGLGLTDSSLSLGNNQLNQGVYGQNSTVLGLNSNLLNTLNNNATNTLEQYRIGQQSQGQGGFRGAVDTVRDLTTIAGNVNNLNKSGGGSKDGLNPRIKNPKRKRLDTFKSSPNNTGKGSYNTGGKPVYSSGLSRRY